MNIQRRPWKPEDHRLYLQTLLVNLPAVIAATSRPLLGIGLILGLWNHVPAEIIQFLVRFL